ncbi:MAG TPA: DUF5985 family protein [Kofleriaceae bacterium]|jgi:hypothetical protein|nr:DUF5985 family protein [Kofleriaceae bacterium]
MAEVVYALCAVTSLVCAVLLGRAYRQSKRRLLMWSTLCFVGLFLNNVLTFVDLVLVPAAMDLHWLRSSVGFIAVALLAIGLVWETK